MKLFITTLLAMALVGCGDNVTPAEKTDQITVNEFDVTYRINVSELGQISCDVRITQIKGNGTPLKLGDKDKIYCNDIEMVPAKDSNGSAIGAATLRKFSAQTITFVRNGMSPLVAEVWAPEFVQITEPFHNIVVSKNQNLVFKWVKPQSDRGRLTAALWGDFIWLKSTHQWGHLIEPVQWEDTGYRGVGAFIDSLGFDKALPQEASIQISRTQTGRMPDNLIGRITATHSSTLRVQIVN